MHFIIADLLGTLGAFLLFPLIIIIPGYVLGHISQLLRFRELPLFYRISVACLISISCCPITVYLMAKFGGMDFVWVVFGLIWLYFIYLFVSRRVFSLLTLRQELEKHKALVITILICLSITFFLIVDYEIDGQLFRALMTYDYVKHTAVTNAIARTGVPPVNPSFFPSEPVSLFYYYFWFLICSLVDILGGAFISSRHAVLGSIMWGEVSLLLILLIYLKRQGTSLVAGLLPKHYKWGLLLLLVTGLDIIPALSGYVIQLNNEYANVLAPSIEWWNEQVSSWMNVILWVPHHLVALICCLFAFLLINERFRVENARQNPASLLLVSVFALASAFGMSIWVAFVAAAILIVWMSISPFLNTKEEIPFILAIGISTSILLVPFIVDLFDSQSLNRSPLILSVRPFNILKFMRLDLTIIGVQVLHLVALPLNYTLEFGFFLIGGLLYIPYRKSFEERLKREELFMLVVVIVSIVICSFVKSNIKYNDLGWRGLMFAQFGILLVCIPLCVNASKKRNL